FENISLDVGSFISTFVGPILTEIHNILSPLDWLIGPSGLLNMRVPLLSDLAGKTITVVDLIPLFDPDDGPTIVKFVKAIQQLDYLSGLVAQATADAHAGSVLLNFGSIAISNPGHKTDKGFGTSFLGGSLIKGGGLSSLTSLSGASVPDSLPDSGNMTGNGADGSVESFMSALSGSSASGLSFPILKPASIFKLLMGQSDVTLFEYTLPELSFKLPLKFEFPIFPPLVAFISGLFQAKLDLTFGYDATGLFEFFKSKNPLNLLDGFFIDALDPKTGQKIPQASFSAEVAAGAEIDLGIAQAGVEGGITASINFFLDDLNNDNKIRLSEIAANLEANDFDPIAVFDISGEIDFFLKAFLKIDLGFFSFETDYEFARLTLFKFDATFNRPQVLGDVDKDGNLTLNMGPNASQRLHGNVDGHDESFTVSGDSSDILVHFGSTDQHFHGVKKITVTMGDGTETLDMSGVTDASIEEDVTGGAGIDTFRAGNGTVNFDGGVGSDTIYGYNGPGPSGVETLVGGTGNDTFFAQQAATAIMIGGKGSNTFTGGTGINIYSTGSVIATITGGGPGSFNDYVIDPNGPNIQIVSGGVPGIFDFSQFTDTVTFYIEHHTVLAVGGAQGRSKHLNSTIGFAGLNDYAHEAYGLIGAFSAVLGGKSGDVYNVWETDQNATDPLILDGQSGSDVYNIFGYDSTRASSTKLNVKINDADTTGTGTAAKGDTALTSVSGATDLFAGEAVSGTGIADGTVIKSISGSTVNLSKATADAVSGTLTFNASNTWDKDLINITGAANKGNTILLDNVNSTNWEVKSHFGANPDEVIDYVKPALNTSL